MENLFQGPRFEKAITIFTKKKRQFGCLDLNKILLHAVFSQLEIINDFTNKEKLFIRIWNGTINNSAFLLKSFIRTFLYKNTIEIIEQGRSNIWVLRPPGQVRPSFQKEYNGYLKINSPPHLLSWSRKRIKFLDGIKHLLMFFKLIPICSSKVYSLGYAIQNANLSLSAIDLINDMLWDKPPEAVLSLKDFSGLENAIIQIANYRELKTFTTQHAVFHFFKGKNYRASTLALINCVAKNVLCWGEYMSNIFQDHYKDKNIIVHNANLLPDGKLEKTHKKNYSQSIVIALGGRTHLEENINLIKFAKNIDLEKNNILIYIRPHPGLDFKYYRKIIEDLNFDNDLIFEITKDLIHEYNYPKDTIAITGMSGSYYDLLYLGYRIIFYDYGYDVLYNLPLVTTPKRNYDEINLELANGLNQIDWNIQANKISKETLNLKIKERPSLTVPEKIMELIN